MTEKVDTQKCHMKEEFTKQTCVMLLIDIPKKTIYSQLEMYLSRTSASRNEMDMRFETSKHKTTFFQLRKDKVLFRWQKLQGMS